MGGARKTKDCFFKSPEIQVRGIEVDGVRVYKGIPYAQPPIGALRFEPPLALEPSADVFDAVEFGPIAMQEHVMPAPELFSWLVSGASASEDCLSLNIYAPSEEAGKWPVIVYMHGGGFAHGSSSAPVLDGRYIAKTQNIVVVTVNHRLNVFGHLSLRALTSDLPWSSNVGLLDLVSALKWIQRNISFVGGDPENVTIMGQSGGAGKVALLMCMQEAAGLFHRAIMQSPASGFSVQSAEKAAVGSRAILDYLGISQSGAGKLKSVSAHALFSAYQSVVKQLGGCDSFRPSVDDRVLFPDDDGLRIQTHVPTLLGYTDTEATFYLAKQIKNNEISYAVALNRVSRFLSISIDRAAELMGSYSERYPHFSWGKLLSQISGDQLFKMQTLDAAKRLVASGNRDVYLYKFCFDAKIDVDYIGSPHTGELPFVFGNLDVRGSYIENSSESRHLMLQMTQAWADFARTGNPGCELLPEWPRFDAERANTMVLDRKVAVESGPDAFSSMLLEDIERYVPGNAFTFITD